VRAREFARVFHRKGHFVVLGYLSKNHLGVERSKDQGFLEIGFPRFLNRVNLDYFSGPVAAYAAMRLVEEMEFDVVHGFEHYPVIHYAAVHARNRNGAIYVTDWADWISASNKRRLLFARREELYSLARETCKTFCGWGDSHKSYFTG